MDGKRKIKNRHERKIDRERKLKKSERDRKDTHT